MAEKYIINMPLKSTPTDTDLMIIEDAQDTKRITWANVVKPIGDLIDTVDNTVAAHMAESASKHIHSSGSNTNGKYIKFDDGTAICFMKDKKALVGTNTSICQANVTFPSAFIEPPVINFVETKYTFVNYDNYSLIKISKLVVYSISSTNSALTLFHQIGNPVFVQGDAITLDVIAIGRWK